MNKEDSFKAVVDYIDAQFEAYLQEELKIKRSLPAYHDSRLHVCLYFICPTGEFFILNLNPEVLACNSWWLMYLIINLIV